MKSSNPRVESVKPDFRFNSFEGLFSTFFTVNSSTVVLVPVGCEEGGVLERRLVSAEGALSIYLQQLK